MCQKGSDTKNNTNKGEKIGYIKKNKILNIKNRKYILTHSLQKNHNT